MLEVALLCFRQRREPIALFPWHDVPSVLDCVLSRIEGVAFLHRISETHPFLPHQVSVVPANLLNQIHCREIPVRISQFSGIRRLMVMVILIVSACTASRDVNEDPDSEIDAILAAAMAATARASQTVAEIEKRRVDFSATPAVDDGDSHEIQSSAGPIKINWNGPVEPLVKGLADFADYRFLVIGPHPANPVWLSVSGEFENPIIAIPTLNDSVYGHAQITADDKERLITIEYSS